MNPEQLTSTSTKQDLLKEEIQRLAMQTHLAERMKFAPPDLSWQEEPSKIQQGRKSGKWLKVEIIAGTGPITVIGAGESPFFR